MTDTRDIAHLHLMISSRVNLAGHGNQDVNLGPDYKFCIVGWKVRSTVGTVRRVLSQPCSCVPTVLMAGKAGDGWLVPGWTERDSVMMGLIR